MTCSFCFFSYMAERCRERAELFEAEGLLSLASPIRKSAADFEALATGAKKCQCAEVG